MFYSLCAELEQLSVWAVCGMLHACGTPMLLAFEWVAAAQPWGGLASLWCAALAGRQTYW